MTSIEIITSQKVLMTVYGEWEGDRFYTHGLEYNGKDVTCLLDMLGSRFSDEISDLACYECQQREIASIDFYRELQKEHPDQ